MFRGACAVDKQNHLETENNFQKYQRLFFFHEEFHLPLPNPDKSFTFNNYFKACCRRLGALALGDNAGVCWVPDCSWQYFGSQMFLYQPEPAQLGQGGGSWSSQTCAAAGCPWAAEAVRGGLSTHPGSPLGLVLVAAQPISGVKLVLWAGGVKGLLWDRAVQSSNRASAWGG